MSKKETQISRIEPKLFSDNFLFNKFSDDIDNFQDHFRELEDRVKKTNTNGFQEIKYFSSYREYGKNGEIIKDLEKGTHYQNNNGKGFVKALCKKNNNKTVQYSGNFDVNKN